MDRSFFIKTYGCQMNDYDSEKINELLKSNGYKQTFDVEKSDIAILNTCHIREKASQKMYSDLGRLSIFKRNKIKSGNDMKIIVTGCVAQAEGEEILNKSKLVDFVLGPQNFHVLPEILKRKSEKKKFTEFNYESKFKSFPISDLKGVTRLITIQEGCDKFCSFCVVPYTRGSEFSRPIEDVFSEVSNVVKNGAVEVVLLGQNVSSYTSEIFEDSKTKKIHLSDLCKALSKIQGLKRIRYLTSHPNDMNFNLINEHKNNSKLMPFLHLPVQSGSDRILKEMNRKHTRSDYLDFVRDMRDSVPEIAFSSDFIVGYPGETEKDFEDTLDLIKNVNFASSYSFKYSLRPGTPSSLKKDVLDHKILNNRLSKIQKILLDQQNKFNYSFLDKTEEILIISKGKKNNQYVGRTKYLQPVHVFSSRDLIGKMLNVKLEKLTAFSFHGKIFN